MEARVVNNLSPAAAHDGAVRCLLAIELSKKSWVVAVNRPLLDKINLYKLKPCDWKGLAATHRADPEASFGRIEEARGSDLMLRSWL